MYIFQYMNNNNYIFDYYKYKILIVQSKNNENIRINNGHIFFLHKLYIYLYPKRICLEVEITIQSVYVNFI